MGSEVLYWLGLVFGFGGVAAYFWALATRPKWIRVLNGSALLMTGLGLMQAAIIIRPLQLGLYWFSANVLVVALMFSVLIQSVAVLRNRNRRDGTDRRAVPEPSA
jgi:hypothetical protein